MLRIQSTCLTFPMPPCAAAVCKKETDVEQVGGWTNERTKGRWRQLRAVCNLATFSNVEKGFSVEATKESYWQRDIIPKLYTTDFSIHFTSFDVFICLFHLLNKPEIPSFLMGGKAIKIAVLSLKVKVCTFTYNRDIWLPAAAKVSVSQINS